MVILLGRLGKDPVVRRTPSGTPVASYSIATSKHWKDQNGVKHEKTEWHSVVSWRGQAEVVEKYVKKGDLIHVIGNLQTRKWQDTNGVDKYTTEIVTDHIQLIGGRKPDTPQATRTGPTQTYDEAVQEAIKENTDYTVPPPSPEAYKEEDDLPF
jgi:single-strand DNA-binding protein